MGINYFVKKYNLLFNSICLHISSFNKKFKIYESSERFINYLYILAINRCNHTNLIPKITENMKTGELKNNLQIYCRGLEKTRRILRKRTDVA